MPRTAHITLVNSHKFKNRHYYPIGKLGKLRFSNVGSNVIGEREQFRESYELEAQAPSPIWGPALPERDCILIPNCSGSRLR